MRDRFRKRRLPRPELARKGNERRASRLRRERPDEIYRLRFKLFQRPNRFLHVAQLYR